MTAPPPVKKRRRWRKFLIGAIAAGLVLIVAAYFIATSPAFLKGVILPQISKSIGADVTVEAAAIHPFSEITLRNLKVQAGNAAPLVIAPEIHVKYHLWDILGGNLRVDEVALVSPTVELVENPDGSSNLDPLLKKLAAKPSASAAAAPPQPGKASKPPQIALGKFTLSNAAIVKIQNYAGGLRDVLELTNVNITLTDLKNGQTAKLQLDAALSANNHPPTGASGSLEAGIKGGFQFTLTPDLKPGAAGGETHLDISSTSGAFTNFSGFSAALECDVTPTEIKRLDLHFQRNGAPLGELAVNGPLDLEKREGQLELKLQGIDRQLLNLAGAAHGLDFATTTVNSTNEITLTKSGADVAVAGRFLVDKFQMTNADQVTPTMDFAAGYDVTVDTTAQTAVLRRLSLTGTQVNGSRWSARALNEIQLQGRVDFSRPQAISGNLALSSDSLDLTGYYDSFVRAKKSGKPSAAPGAPPAGAAAGGSQEPSPVTLPVQNFTVAADIGKLFLGEVAITNFQMTAKLAAHQVTVKPFQLALNGAPVNATLGLDLSVPGYQYTLAVDAGQVPLAPLVDTFAPERMGQLGGTLTARAQISGAGVTGAGLQKNLAGQFSVGATNLNLSVVNVQSKLLKGLIDVVATIPELIRSPESAIASLFSEVTGHGGGLMNELKQSPIQIIAVRGQAGNGRIELQQATVQSSAFVADAPGEITLRPVLTNSTINFPVTVSVSQSIGQQLGIAAGGSANGSSYVPLPQFLTMTGTLGDPQKQIKKSALVGLAAKSIGGGLFNQGTNAASKVGGLLNNLLGH